MLRDAPGVAASLPNGLDEVLTIDGLRLPLNCAAYSPAPMRPPVSDYRIIAIRLTLAPVWLASKVIGGLAGEIVDAGSRRDQIARVADRIDCAKLTELIRRQVQCANIDLLCLHAADVDLRDFGDIVVARRVHPAAANHGGAGRRGLNSCRREC